MHYYLKVVESFQLGWFISLRYEKEKIAVELSDLRENSMWEQSPLSSNGTPGIDFFQMKPPELNEMPNLG